MTIHEFIATHKITMTCDRADSNPAMDATAPGSMDHWKCKLAHTSHRMTVPFSMGYGYNGKEPTAADVLSCLASDASGITSDFEEWARDLGYDPDSRTAERTYKACVKSAEKLKTFLGADLYDTLLYHTEAL